MYDEGLNGLARQCYEIAVSKGWWDESEDISFGNKIALCHSELSEALERYREHGEEGVPIAAIWCDEITKKPEGIPAELADVLIRVLDMCGFYEIDIDAALEAKIAYNATRSYRHGNKAC